MVNTFLPALLLFVRCGGTVAEHLNVYDEPIQTCSQDGTALTGWTRSGSCVDHDDDSGSHHICIDLSSTASAGNFCTVTGQSDWCSSTDMPCHEDPNSGECAIEHWCVCQWAFESYLKAAGGCGSIQDIQCEAINKAALDAYREDEERHAEALACLVERCGLQVS